MVGLNVVVVYTWNVVEGPERLDMMHIESAFVLLLCLAAALTFVPVTLASAAALLVPVRAVKLKSATLPVGGVLARFIFGLPLGKTRYAAERARIFLHVGFCAKDYLLAYGTRHLDTLACAGSLIASHILRAPLPVTCAIAEVTFSGRDLPLLALKRCIAIGAINGDGWLTKRAGRGISPRIKARLVAKVVLVDFDEVGATHQNGPAVRTGDGLLL